MLDKWQNFPLALQMGHIGAELTRAWHCKEKGEQRLMENSLWRALAMIDLTVQQATQKAIQPARLKEILRFREVACDFFLDLGNFLIQWPALQGYFLPFTLVRPVKT